MPNDSVAKSKAATAGLVRKWERTGLLEGLGKEYEKATGLKLSEENTLEGITRQIQFALDKAAEGKSWQPWYGRKKAGVSVTEGLTNAKPLYNWRKE